jgi:FemAB-related protein (PEP-CTERM system-associated)
MNERRGGENMDVAIIQTDAPDCREFVRSRSDGRLCFLPAWGFMVERVFGHRSFYLAARENGKTSGVLPLVHVRSRLFGNRMISQAFVDYGGILAESVQARDALFRRAVELATECGCQNIEFRNVHPLPYELVLRSDKVGMHLPLGDDPDALWKGFDAKVRNQVRKAEKSGIEAVIGGTELLDGFYRVYTARMRQLGTPAYSRRLMEAVLETFPDNTRIIAVRLRGLTVGAGLTTCSRNYAEMLYAAALTEYHQLCPNNLLYWTAITHYCRMGVRCFDFGRSTMDSGTHRFKQQWGPQEVNLHYQYWVRPGRELAMAIPNGARYRRKVEMWKKLPLWLTRLVGPMISRGLP